MLNKKDSPATPGLAHQRQAEATKIVRDVYAGPLHIRSEGATYLPRFPGEVADDHGDPYKERLGTAVFYDVFRRTVDGLTGLVFRKPPRLNPELPSDIKKMSENVDGAGTHIDLFLADRHRDAETDGLFVVFVDMAPPSDSEFVRADQKDRLPYWIGIEKQNVLAAEYTMIGGKEVLTHFRYKTSITAKDGRYGQKEVEQIREYNLASTESGPAVQYIVHTKREGASVSSEEWDEAKPAYMEIDEIPVVVGYHGRRKGPCEADPPSLGLALENIKHYQLVSDNDNVLHKCSAPILASMLGEHEESRSVQRIGPHHGWQYGHGGDLKYVEPQGNGLEHAAKRIEKSEQRMAILGISLLMSETRVAETATSKQINKAESDSALTRHARSTQDGGEEAIRLSAKWLDLPLPERGVNRWLTINTDFTNIEMDPQVMLAYITAISEAGLPKRVLLEAWQKGGRISENEDLELLAVEMDAAKAASDEQREIEIAERLRNAAGQA